MTLYTDLIPSSWVLLKRRCFYVPGTSGVGIDAPLLTTHVRAVGMASGGQGEANGGSSALARAVQLASPGENFSIQVGQLSTAGTVGDSYVRRTSNGAYVIYVDRGRSAAASPVGGKAANSVGDLKLDGVNGGGAAAAPPTDPSIFSLFPVGYSGDASSPRAANDGGGGRNISITDATNSHINFAAYAAGGGKVFIEFYQGDPAH